MSKKIVSLIIGSAMLVTLPLSACPEHAKNKSPKGVPVSIDSNTNKQTSTETRFNFSKAAVNSNVKVNNVFKVEGMTCNSCVNAVKKAISSVKGVKSANVDLKSEKAVVEFISGIDKKMVLQEITKAIEKSGYKATISEKI